MLMDTAGSLDQAFGTNGVVSITVPGYPYPTLSTVLNTGSGTERKIYFAGVGEGGQTSEMPYFLGRLHSDGTADTSFGENGLVVGHFSKTSLIKSVSIALRDDGKIVLFALATGREFYEAFALSRYNDNGILDTTFGIDGHTLLDLQLFPPTNEQPSIKTNPWSQTTGNAVSPNSLEALPDGKLLVFKSYSYSLQRAYGVIVRLTENGHLDLDFNQVGYITVFHPDYILSRTILTAIMVQADGKYLGCGCVDDLISPYSAMFVRYDTTGKLDPSFGNGGFVIVAPDENGGLLVDRMALQPNNRVLGFGSADSKPTVGMMTSIEPDGSPNIQFNRGKPFYTNVDPTGMTAWTAGDIHKDGKIVAVGGVGQYNGDIDVLVARFIDAQFDPSFNEGQGWVRTPTQSSMAYSTGVSLQDDGKILVCAFTTGQGTLMRYHG